MCHCTGFIGVVLIVSEGDHRGKDVPENTEYFSHEEEKTWKSEDDTSEKSIVQGKALISVILSRGSV